MTAGGLDVVYLWCCCMLPDSCTGGNHVKNSSCNKDWPSQQVNLMCEETSCSWGDGRSIPDPIMFPLITLVSLLEIG